MLGGDGRRVVHRVLLDGRWCSVDRVTAECGAESSLVSEVSSGRGPRRPSRSRPGAGPRRRRRRVHPAGGAAAPGAARALLPHARLGPRRRRRPAGRAAAGVARARALRGPQLAALVALHRGHPHLPGRRRAPRPAGAADGPRPVQRPRGGRRRPADRRRLARALPRRRPRRPAAPDARYEQREAVELAFVAALQHLPGNQRAALLLFEVLGFSAAEIAAMMDTSTASVNSALQRARRIVAEKVPAPAASSRRCGSSATRGCGRSSPATPTALERGDADALVALLTEDVTWSMPPLPHWYRGLRRGHRLRRRASR